MRNSPGRHLGWRRLCICLILLLLFGGAAQPALGAADAVESITVRNNYLLARRTVLGVLGFQTGMRFQREKIEAAVERWNSSGRWGTLAYRAERPAKGGVELVLELTERIQLSRVSFRGNERVSSDRLREVIGLNAGDRVGRFDVRAAQQQVRFAYQDQGYAGASVEAALQVSGELERELVFYVDEGVRSYVEEIVFEGNRSMEDGELEDVMRNSERGWLSFIWPGWLDSEAFPEDLRRIRDLYRSKGYLDAEVTGRPTYSEDMRRATLRVHVEEGPLYHVRDVQFRGNELFKDEELVGAVPFERGEPYLPEHLEEAAEKISELYADQGYVDLTRRKGNLRAETLFAEEAPRVDVRFTINEGERVHIRRIRIEGLTKTREDVVRRNLAFYPGELARKSKLEESRRLLINTAYFDQEARKPVDISLEPDEGTLRDAVVRVKEGPTGRLMVGAGVGSESGLLGELSVTENNFDIWNWPSSWDDFWRGNAFRGGGQQLSLVLRAGTERSYYSVSFRDPAVYNTDYSFGFELYSRGIVRNEFDETRTGFNVSAGQRLSSYLHRGLTVGYESIDIDDVDSTAALEIQRDEGSFSKPFLRFEAELDRRDNRILPTEGHLVGMEVEAAAGDIETLKLILRGEKHWTVRQRNGRYKHVVGVRGQLGVVDTYGDRVPVFERFYAGGLRSLRGFQYEGVSPVDPATEDQVGGESMLVGSLEYSLPVSRDEKVRLIGFVDAGYVAEDAEDVFTGWDELRMSVGVGVQWQIPLFGPTSLEVDLAAPVMSESGDETQNIHFSLGAQRAF